MRNKVSISYSYKSLYIILCIFAFRCLEWGGSDIVITAGYSAYLSSTNVRNDLLATNVLTGQKQRIRPEAEESPIELIKVSHYQ